MAILRTVHFGPAEPFFRRLRCIHREMKVTATLASERDDSNMAHITNRPISKLRKAPQPPLSHPGATPDADRAKRLSLAQPCATDQELTPGDRVEGLGNSEPRLDNTAQCSEPTMMRQSSSGMTTAM
jgi:hypothetical protein